VIASENKGLKRKFGTKREEGTGICGKVHNEKYVRSEVFIEVTMKNGVFLDVTPCDSCKNRRFGGT
jgi:hypothetical protein